MAEWNLDLTVRGDLVLPGEILEDGVAGVKDGRIVGIYRQGSAPPAGRTVDAKGKLVFPGLVDAHVHAHSNPEEGFEHATAAAAAGGVTTIIEMPYDWNAPVVTPEVFREKVDLIGRKVKVDVALLATLPKDGDTRSIRPMAKLGACGFKLSVFETDPVRFPRIENDVLFRALPAIADCDLPVGFHAEDDSIVKHLTSELIAAGRTDPLAHCQSRPPLAESLAVAGLLELAHGLGIRLHLYHVSHPRCLDLIDWYREQGVDVSAETCPHYLAFCEDDMTRLKAFTKINPPVRKQWEVTEMWRALQAGRIDFVTTDHAPWPLSKKQSPNIFENASGAPGLELSLALLYTLGVVGHGMNPLDLARLLAENPARRFKLASRKGRIAVGADADFAVFDPTCNWTFDASRSQCSAKWSPYEGLPLRGRVVTTILRGQIVYDGSEVLAPAGSGRFIPADGC